MPTAIPPNGAYTDVNGAHLYHETFEPADASAAVSRRPLILLHGGLESGARFASILPALAADRRVITVDLEGHGRTPDIDRPLDPRVMADDVAALVRHLGIAPADVLGYSLGGAVALHMAVNHPDVLRRAVIASANATRDSFYPELRAQSSQMGAGLLEVMKQTPMYQEYERVAPRPEDFPRLLDKIGAWIRSPFDYREDYASVKVPVMITCADADGAPPRHYVELFESLGGGQRDGGFMGEGRPEGGHALAILPGLTHYTIASSPLLADVTLAFLDGA